MPNLLTFSTVILVGNKCEGYSFPENADEIKKAIKTRNPNTDLSNCSKNT